MYCSFFFSRLVRLFRGTDFNSAAVICDKLIALHCAASCVHDYVSRWRSGLNCLSSAGHLFDQADSLQHFIKHLPFGSTYDIIQESVFFSLSTACTANQLPSFKAIAKHVMNFASTKSISNLLIHITHILIHQQQLHLTLKILQSLLLLLSLCFPLSLVHHVLGIPLPLGVGRRAFLQIDLNCWLLVPL